MKLHKIAMLIACIISTPALAWSNGGNFDGSVDFGGSVKPVEYSQLWRWKVGTGLNDFRNNISEMAQDQKKLTITMDSPKGLLYGETVEAMTASEGMGAIPNIAFTDYEDNTVSLEQDSSDSDGRGHMTLPIKDEQNNKIGTLKLNVTAVGLAVGPYFDNQGGTILAMSANASTNSHVLYGGLFARSIGNAYSTGNALVSTKFGGKSLNDIKADLWRHPVAASLPMAGWTAITWASPVDFKEGEDKFLHGIASVSYVMGLDEGQTMEATFDNPITATTKWSAPLNVAVTYN
ncbi:hypothetical protein OGY83_18055 [Citrobacter sp. Cpo090]|uniref:F4 family fimbrial subunit n=1 Tax=Citrobacter sp. Cpo090 TaxID=2985139 RepID=UPI002577E175|nr:hypothetical protein [Citrobacter sp. Cpo090]MDM2845524.1 hypothetical protein [Citrobacter sp. Cpo090]